MSLRKVPKIRLCPPGQGAFRVWLGGHARLDRSDIRIDGRINNLDAILLYHWLLGTVPLIPAR